MPMKRMDRSHIPVAKLNCGVGQPLSGGILILVSCRIITKYEQNDQEAH
jgi:hypothetical protein